MSSNVPVIQLIGDIEENFYQLGLKDKENILPIQRQMRAIQEVGQKTIDGAVEKFLSAYSFKLLKSNSELDKIISAYAEGAQQTKYQIMGTFLLPEVLASFDKFTFNPAPLFGCGSAFYWHEEHSSPTHYRTLDFPLVNAYDKYERVLHLKLDGQPQIWSYGTAGFPFPSITAMNEHGVSVAMHQKNNDIQYYSGTSIFYIVYDLLVNATDKKSALEVLKRHKSLTIWGLKIGFSNGDILCIDLEGDKHHIIEKKLDKGEIFYINNLPINKKCQKQSGQPWGRFSYCQDRHEVWQKKCEIIKNKNSKSKSSFSQSDLFHSFASRLDQSKGPAKEYRLDNLTSSTVAVVSMNPGMGFSKFVPGKAPKNLEGEVLAFNDTWQNYKSEHEKVEEAPFSLCPQKPEAMTDLALAQSYYDLKEWNRAFHHIQMAIIKLNEGHEKNIAKFWFNVFQTIKISREEELNIYLKEFKALQELLPPYLRDHCLMFIFRLEIILGRPNSVKVKEISTPKLKELYKFEKKLKPMILKKMKNLILPRLDIWDIIYPYFK